MNQQPEDQPIEPIGKIESWRYILDMMQAVLIEAVSGELEMDMEYADTNVDGLKEILVNTSEGEYWHKFRVIDHASETTIELSMSLHFAPYKKPKGKK